MEIKKLLLVFLPLITLIGIFYNKKSVKKVLDKVSNSITDTSVVKIENFSDSNRKLVLFYAPWCGYCKKLKPDWDKLTDSYPEIVTKINCDEDKNKEIANQNNIEGYPTIKYFPTGMDGASVDYDGSRDYKSLVKFLKDNSN